jgi:hypothetical protein
MGAFEYDPTDSDPVSKMQFSNYMGCTQSVLWRNFGIAAHKKALGGIGPDGKYVRTSKTTGSTDRRTSDSGVFFAYIPNAVFDDARNKGSIWVHYRVKLMFPHIIDPFGEIYGGSLRYGIPPRLDDPNNPQGTLLWQQAEDYRDVDFDTGQPQNERHTLNRLFIGSPVEEASTAKYPIVGGIETNRFNISDALDPDTDSSVMMFKEVGRYRLRIAWAAT